MADKDYREIIVALRAQNWELTQTSQGHWRAASPDRTQSLVHFSTSDDHRAVHNTLRDLSKSGFIWPPPSKKEVAAERRLETEAVDALVVPATAERLAGLDAYLEAHPDHRAEPLEEQMDRVFKELKDAKAYYALARAHEGECRAAVAKAQRAHKVSAEEFERAAEALRQKKKEFDSVFGTAV